MQRKIIMKNHEKPCMIKLTKQNQNGGFFMVQLHSTTKKRSFKHLTSSSRGIIYALYNEKKSLQEIAEAVSCHKSTVSRELKRGLVAQKTTQGKIVNKYFPETGQLN